MPPAARRSDRRSLVEGSAEDHVDFRQIHAGPLNRSANRMAAERGADGGVQRAALRLADRRAGAGNDHRTAALIDSSSDWSYIDSPPSTGSTTPVMYPAASDARNATAAAISAGSA